MCIDIFTVPTTTRIRRPAPIRTRCGDYWLHSANYTTMLNSSIRIPTTSVRIHEGKFQDLWPGALDPGLDWIELYKFTPPPLNLLFRLIRTLDKGKVFYYSLVLC